VLTAPPAAAHCLPPAGLFEQYNQALISASYGKLSLSADVAVLPEVMIPYNLPDSPSNFSYYEDGPRKVSARAGGGLVGG